VSVLCGTVRDRLDEYLADALAADDRRELREHFASCESCVNEITRIEPSLLFARIPADEVSSEDVLAVLTGVRAGEAAAVWRRCPRRQRSRR
jgi:hypothetical protein